MVLLLWLSPGMCMTFVGFPGGASGKEPICHAGDIREAGSIPGSGRSSGEWYGSPLQFLPRESPGQRSLVSYSP